MLVSQFSLFGNLFSCIRSPVLETNFSYLSLVHFFFFCSNFRKIYSPLFSNSFIELLCICVHSCPTLCNTIDCSPPGSTVHGIPRQEYWSGLPFILQGIFQTLGSNPGLLCLLHCRGILYCLSYLGKHPMFIYIFLFLISKRSSLLSECSFF